MPGPDIPVPEWIEYQMAELRGAIREMDEAARLLAAEQAAQSKLQDQIRKARKMGISLEAWQSIMQNSASENLPPKKPQSAVSNLNSLRWVGLVTESMSTVCFVQAETATKSEARVP